MSKFDSFVSWGVGIAGLIGIGYAIGTHTKMAKISDMLDRSIDELARGTTVDIPEEVVACVAVERCCLYRIMLQVML